MTSSAIQVTLAWHQNDCCDEIIVSLMVGATIADAFDAAKAITSPALQAMLATHTGVGVWGKARGLTHVLRDQDRVELYRALQADPKEARRQRVEGGRRRGRLASSPR